MVIDPNNSGPGRTSTSGASISRQKPATSSSNENLKQNGAESVSVSLSSEAKTLGRLEQAVHTSPDVDEQKVASIKQAVADGRYQIDANRIAERMLNQGGFP
jgi:negative regulator of flagellin synthesis FlgM